MILSCERCTARFAVDDAQLGAGRKVRCSSCGHIWFQARKGETPAPERQIAPEFRATAATEPTAAPVVPPEPSPEDQSRTLRRFGASASRKPEPPPRQRLGRQRAVGFAVRALPVAALIAAAFGLRSELVEIWPPAARLFDTIGLPVSEAAPGLAIRAVHMEEQMSNGHRTVIVQGELANTGAEAHKVPPLHASLGQGNQTVARWSFAAGPGELAPGEVAQFSTQLADAPEGARTVSVGLWR